MTQAPPAGGWHWATLADIADKIVDGSHNPPPRVDNGLPMLSARNIGWGSIELSDFRQISREHFEMERRRADLQPGDVLLTIVGTIGRVAVIGDSAPEFALQRSVAMIRTRRLLPHFCAYQMMSDRVQTWLRSRARGSAQQGVYLGTLAGLPMLVPTLSEQQVLVEEIDKQFTRLDAGVTALRRVQANLKRYRAAVFKAACEGRLVPTEAELARREGRSYETGGALLERTLVERRRTWTGRSKYQAPVEARSEELPSLPVGWAWALLDQLLAGLRNGVSAKPDADSGLPILRISAVRPLSVNLDDVRYLSLGPNAFQDYRLRTGDLLFTRYNGNRDLVGVCGVVRTVFRPVIHPDKLIRGQLVEGCAIPTFVGAMANVGVSREHLAKRVRTTAGQSGISGGDLKSLPIPLPPFAEQVRIVAEVERRLSVADEIEAAVKANLQRATRLRQSVLQRAFSSELVPARRVTTPVTPAWYFGLLKPIP